MKSQWKSKNCLKAFCRDFDVLTDIALPFNFVGGFRETGRFLHKQRTFYQKSSGKSRKLNLSCLKN